MPQKSEEQEKFGEILAETIQPHPIQKKGDTNGLINNNRTSSTLYQTALQSRLAMPNNTITRCENIL